MCEDIFLPKLITTTNGKNEKREKDIRITANMVMLPSL